jgi:F-type H+-transporting ATPase subunit b
MRKKSAVFLMIIVLASSFVAPAFAAEEAAEHGGFFKEWGWKIINFALLAGILVYFAKKPLAQFLRGRTEAIRKSLDEATAAREAAEKALREVEEKLKLREKEIADIVAAARGSGLAEKDALMREAERMSERLMEQTRANIDFELKRAKDAIRQEAVELAIELAEQKLREKMTPEEQKRLIEESIAKLEARGS